MSNQEDDNIKDETFSDLQLSSDDEEEVKLDSTPVKSKNRLRRGNMSNSKCNNMLLKRSICS
jgi:hypothetical protein